MIRMAGRLSLILLLSIAPQAASADMLAQVHLAAQEVRVFIDGEPRHTWPISSGRVGYETPTGEYRPERVYERYFSRKYDNAPMPHAVFFHRGYAIHGTTMVGRLGRRASRGCIRLHPDAARTFFELVRRHGPDRTKIVVVDRPPALAKAATGPVTNTAQTRVTETRTAQNGAVSGPGRPSTLE